MEVKKFGNNKYGVNSYLIIEPEQKQAVVIDPAVNFRDLSAMLDENEYTLIAMILTHGHIDHIADCLLLKERYQSDIYIHELDEEMLEDDQKSLAVNFGYHGLSFSADYVVKDGDILDLGPFQFHIIHTPGHTKGGVCVLLDNMMFTGDTLFKGSMGRTDLYGGNETHMRASLYRLSQKDENILVFPGHGPQSTIGQEKAMNPFLKML